MISLLFPARPWMMAPGALFAGGGGEAPPAFVGPLDDFTTNLGGALSEGRRLLSSYTGPLIRVRRSSDNTESDFGYVDDGECLLDETALLAFTGANDGFLRTIYDQTGNSRHQVQTTSGLQPAIVLSGVVQKVNNLPKATGLNKQMISASNYVQRPFTVLGSMRNGVAGSAAYGYAEAGGLIFFDTAQAGSGLMDFAVGADRGFSIINAGFSDYELIKPQLTWDVRGFYVNSGATQFWGFDDDEVIASEGTGFSTYESRPLILGSSGVHAEYSELVYYSVQLDTTTRNSVLAVLKNAILPLLLLTMAGTVDSAIAGQTAAEAIPLYSTLDHVTPTYVRSLDSWGIGFVSALTAASVWNSDGGSQKAGTLISPRHVLFAKHYTPATSSTMRWVKADGTVVTRTLSAVSVLSDLYSYYPDLTVGLLDSDVGAGIEFARVLPDDWTNWLPADDTEFAAAEVPLLVMDQDKHLHLRECSGIPLAQDGSLVGVQVPQETQRGTFYQPLTGGDSGTPSFFIIDGKMVLVNCNVNTGGQGAPITEFKAEINAAMATLGGGYTLTDINLSGYRTI